MTIWDDLTLEEYVVLITAREEAYLNDILDEYGTRLRRAKTGDCRQMSNLDDDAKRRLTGRFADVVAAMIDKDWIQIREPHGDGWDDAPPMTPEQVDETLHDPAAWLIPQDGTHRMVMLMLTDSLSYLAEPAR